MAHPHSSHPSSIAGIVFDIDGVIFDSSNINVGYYNTILKKLNLDPMSSEDEDYCQMASWQQCFARIVPPELHETALEIRDTYQYKDFILPKLNLETGLLEALTWLKDLKIPLGICTNRFDGVEDLLHYFGLETFFSPLKTAHTCPPKPDPQGLQEILAEWKLPAHQVAFLGDTAADEQAARAASIRFWAYKSPSLTADLYFTDFFSFIDIIRPLVEKE